jgi:hypothetical protein
MAHYSINVYDANMIRSRGRQVGALRTETLAVIGADGVPRPVEPMGVRELAEVHRVTRTAICNWKRRHPDFPQPLFVLASGPVYDGYAVRDWHARGADKS